MEKLVSYSEVFKELQIANLKLEQYMFKNESSSFVLARNILSDISNKCFENADFLFLVNEWLSKKHSTLALKSVLDNLPHYKQDSLDYFNAFQLIESALLQDCLHDYKVIGFWNISGRHGKELKCEKCNETIVL
jgi:hypothetical protein